MIKWGRIQESPLPKRRQERLMSLWEWELVRRRSVEAFSHEVPTFLSAVMVGWLCSGKRGKKPQGRRIEITVKLEKGADQVMKGLDCKGRAEARDPWALPAAMPHSWRTRVLWAEWVR